MDSTRTALLHQPVLVITLCCSKPNFTCHKCLVLPSSVDITVTAVYTWEWTCRAPLLLLCLPEVGAVTEKSHSWVMCVKPDVIRHMFLSLISEF